MIFSNKISLFTIASVVALMSSGAAVAQQSDYVYVAPYETDSVGRGAPYINPRTYDHVGPGVGGIVAGAPSLPNPPIPDQPREIIAARDGAVPDGIEALPRDIFTSDDFYVDEELWSDPRYFRCNSGLALESQWGAYGGEIIGSNAPASGAWGFCDRDYPREGIVSPYKFDTAQEHYEALLAEVTAKGGPTKPSYEMVEQWTGRYQRGSLENWWYQRINQIPTILSLLTPEYQKRMVQEAYHQSNTNAAQWPSQFCWPEGFMRRFHQYSVRGHEMIATPSVVQWMAGVADNFLTQVHIGREFNFEGEVPRLGQDVPRWYGETIGFWDGEALITWTSNIQGWVTHNAFENSSKLQTIEIYTPMYNDDGSFKGVYHESVFYDPEALVQPVRQVREMERVSGFEERDPYVFVECNQTIFPIDGRAQPVSPGQVIDYRVPDRFGRPWAQTWELYHEEGMQRPEAEALFGF